MSAIGTSPWSQALAGRRLHLAALVLIAASHFAIAAYWQPSTDTFPIDDPYIHLVYGANFAAGEGFAFNRGEPSMGTSSPLWTVVVAAVTVLSANVIGALSALGSLLFLASAVLLYLLVFHVLAREGEPPERAATTAVLGALVLSTSGNALWISFSGMETPLVLAAMLLAGLLDVRSARPWWLGLALAVAVLTRLEGLYLIGALLVGRIAIRQRIELRALSSFAIPLSAFAAFCAYSWHAVGALLPTTVGGKKATYVSGDLDPVQALSFVGDYFSFLSHEPAYLPLMAALLGYGGYVCVRVGQSLMHGEAMRFGTAELLSVWALAHLGSFALLFRSLLHYGRYFVVLMPAAVVVSALLAHRAASSLAGGRYRFAPAGILALLLVLNAADLPDWKALYHHDLRHIRETYVASAKWVRDNTPEDSVVAVYDIGAVKYYSGRRIVDLFGLLDERLHPLLRKRDASEYLRASGADYVLYLQSPNAEHHTRVYLAEYGRDFLLEQRFVEAFRSIPYPQPTVTQSFEISAYEIRAWHRANPEGRRRQFVVGGAIPESADLAGGQFGESLELVGVEIDAERQRRGYALRRVLRVQTLGFRITLYWRVLDGPQRLPEAELSFVDPRTGHVWLSARHVIAHGRVDGLVKAGEVVREPHYVWLPIDVPNIDLAVRMRAYPRRSQTTLRVGPTAETAVTIATLRVMAPEPVAVRAPPSHASAALVRSKRP